MRRKWIIGSGVGGALLLAGALWQLPFSEADPAQPAPGDKGPVPRPVENPLPIRQVVLFNTGVGYFQREGQVDGSSRIELKVATDGEAPSPELYFKIGDDALSASYKVRHTRSYTIRNRSTHNRTVIVEHAITAGWDLLEPKAVEKARDVYRFEVAAPAGKTVVHKVTEEEATGSSLKLALTPLGCTVEPRSDVHVKVLRKTSEPRITGLRLEKGVLIMQKQVRESTSYFVQNLSKHDRECTIDHIIRAGWQLLEPEETKIGPAVQRTVLKVAGLKTGVKEFAEERTTTEKLPAGSTLSEARTKEIMLRPAASVEVKAGLAKSLALAHTLHETAARQAELQQQLRALSDDQTRMRQNLSIIPQSSDHYKRFLEKFVSQETEVENLQKQLRQVQTTVQEVQRQYELFIANLSAE